jgi:hypothetical protein
MNRNHSGHRSVVACIFRRVDQRDWLYKSNQLSEHDISVEFHADTMSWVIRSISVVFRAACQQPLEIQARSAHYN